MLPAFEKLGVPADLIQGLEDLKFVTPTQIQEKAIPFLIEDGGDFIAQAQTGTGKTAAFGLPLITKMDPTYDKIQGLVIAPTRELAKQIGKHLFRFTKYCEKKIFVETLTGGDPIDRQIAALSRPTQIVVATPGRLIDLMRRKALTLWGVEHLVLDEADEMLNMGFKKELSQVFDLTKKRASTWLFSATIPDVIDILIKDCMKPGAHLVKIDQGHVVNRDIDHRYFICKLEDKVEFITDYLRSKRGERGLLFCRTISDSKHLCRKLTALGFSVGLLQGDLDQRERDKVMRGFKKERFQYLVATDVAARGIDVEGLSFVIHHQLSDQTDHYTHRSGRTARAGKKGVSIALITQREKQRISGLEKDLKVRFKEFGQ
jgi:ATP-dependent RNA helicase DeaD